MQHGSTGNILMNGRFAHWRRLDDAEAGVECLMWRQTYAADRWKIRYSRPEGASVWQARSADEPKYLPGGSLEIRGAVGVSETALLGQRIESAESSKYRRRLYFSAWVKVEGPIIEGNPVSLHLGTAKDRDVFGDAFNNNVRPLKKLNLGIAPSNEWTRLECEIDGRSFDSSGLSLELEFPASALNSNTKYVRVAGVTLSDNSTPTLAVEPSTELENLQGKRFFQRHDRSSITTLGRSLSVKEWELRFQFQFPEMRIPPACTLVGGFHVFDKTGKPVDGFIYEVVDSSRGSVIIRAIKEHHGVTDGYLAFGGKDAAILLEAEL